MERRLTYLTNKIEGDEIPIRPFVETSYILEGRSGPQIVDELDPKLAEHEERVSQMQGSYETLGKRMAELEEARQVLRETATFFLRAHSRQDREDIRASFDEPTAPLLENAMEQGYGTGEDGEQDIECVKMRV
jgi:V-type H+-transporting ATPase subunit a